jgi:hypothetical protein
LGLGDAEVHEEGEDKEEAVSGATALHDPHSDWICVELKRVVAFAVGPVAVGLGSMTLRGLMGCKFTETNCDPGVFDEVLQLVAKPALAAGIGVG